MQVNQGNRVTVLPSPHAKIELLERVLDVSRPSATKYLGALEKAGIVRKTKLGRSNFYINEPLFSLLGLRMPGMEFIKPHSQCPISTYRMNLPQYENLGASCAGPVAEGDSARANGWSAFCNSWRRLRPYQS